MAEIYATHADVYRAVPGGSLVARARPIASINATTNRIEVAGHACALNTPILFDTDEGGSLPPELSASTVYYAKPVAGSDSLLEVAASENGSAINLSTAGTDPMRLVIPVGPLLDMLLEAYSRDFDAMCIGHTVPFESPYPALATHYVAVMTAWSAAIALGLGGQSDRLRELKDEVTTKALRWGKGAPLRDAAATTASNLARGRTPSRTTRDTEVIP